jgi:hypothetical protein
MFAAGSFQLAPLMGETNSDYLPTSVEDSIATIYLTTSYAGIISLEISKSVVVFVP